MLINSTMLNKTKIGCLGYKDIQATRRGARSFTDAEDKLMWFKYCAARENTLSGRVNFSSLTENLKIPGRNADQIRQRIKNIAFQNPRLRDRLNEMYQKEKSREKDTNLRFGFGPDNATLAIAKWLYARKTTLSNGVYSVAREHVEEMISDLGDELEMEHAQELSFYIFNNKAQIQDNYKKMRRREGLENLSSVHDASSVSVQSEYSQHEVIDLVENDNGEDFGSERAASGIDNDDSESFMDFDHNLSQDEVSINPLHFGPADAMSSTCTTVPGGVSIVDYSESEAESDAEIGDITTDRMMMDAYTSDESSMEMRANDSLPKTPILPDDFRQKNLYTARYNLYEYERAGLIPPRFSPGDLTLGDTASARNGKCIYKAVELRSFFDYVEVKRIPWDRLLEPRVIQEIFDAVDEGIMKQRIEQFGKTSEDLQIDVFKFALPNRKEYIFQYDKKSSCAPFNFKTLGRLLSVLMFHSFAIESDWSRTMQNFFIDGILCSGTHKHWLAEFYFKLEQHDEIYFACSKVELIKMKEEFSKRIVFNI